MRPSRAFVQAFNQVITDKERLIEDFNVILPVLTDNTALDKDAAKLTEECAVVMELIRKGVDENAHSVLDQAEYQEQYNMMAARYEEVKNQLEVIVEEKHSRAAKREGLARFIHEIEQREGLLTEFSEALWNATVEAVTVCSEKDMEFRFKYGNVIHIDTRGR